MTSKEQITRLADEDGGKGANLKGKSSTQRELTLQKTVRLKEGCYAQKRFIRTEFDRLEKTVQKIISN